MRPGNTALTLTFGPWVAANAFIMRSAAAFDTAYGKELAEFEMPFPCQHRYDQARSSLTYGNGVGHDEDTTFLVRLESW
jgi:hypothetical protein